METGAKLRSPEAIRQQRRREHLRAQQVQKVETLLTKGQGEMLSTLVSEGYAPNKGAAIARAISEAFERESKNEKDR